MNKQEFKKVLDFALSDYGFVTKNNILKAETDELIIVVSTQKSNYDNSYYLNYGFMIKALSSDLTSPKDTQCDVFGRLNLYISGKFSTTVEIENISCEVFSESLKVSLDERIKPVIEFGLVKYFDLFPTAISTVKLNAKKYLGIS